MLPDPKVLTELGLTGLSLGKMGGEFLEGGGRGNGISPFPLTQELRRCLDGGNVGPCYNVGQTPLPRPGQPSCLGYISPLLFFTKCNMRLFPLAWESWFGTKRGFQFALSPNVLRVAMIPTLPFCLPAADPPPSPD